MGSQFDLFLSYIFPYKTFFELKLRAVFCHFWPQDFFIPLRVNLLSSFGVPIWPLSVLHHPLLFWVQFTASFCSFFTPKIVYRLTMDLSKDLLWATNLILFRFYIFPKTFFLVSNLQAPFYFWSRKFLFYFVDVGVGVGGGLFCL